MSLTPAQLDQFHRDGYIIVPDLFTADEMVDALVAMEQIFYGQILPAVVGRLRPRRRLRGLGTVFTTTHDPLRGPLAVSRGCARFGSANRKRDLPRRL